MTCCSKTMKCTFAKHFFIFILAQNPSLCMLLRLTTAINQCSLAACQMAVMQQWPSMWRKSQTYPELKRLLFTLRVDKPSALLHITGCSLSFLALGNGVRARDADMMQHDADWFEQMTEGKRDRRPLLNEHWRKTLQQYQCKSALWQLKRLCRTKRKAKVGDPETGRTEAGFCFFSPDFICDCSAESQMGAYTCGG